MDNNYFTQVAPYMQQQDQSGLTPVFQNIGAQQALHNQLMQQQNQQTQDAGNIGSGMSKGMSGLNPLAMAMALRGKQDPYAINKGDPYANSQTAMKLNSPENVYGYGGQGQIPVWNGEM